MLPVKMQYYRGITKQNCIQCIVALSHWTRVIMYLKFFIWGVIQQCTYETSHYVDNLRKVLTPANFVWRWLSRYTCMMVLRFDISGLDRYPMIVHVRVPAYCILPSFGRIVCICFINQWFYWYCTLHAGLVTINITLTYTIQNIKFSK